MANYFRLSIKERHEALLYATSVSGRPTHLLKKTSVVQIHTTTPNDVRVA